MISFLQKFVLFGWVGALLNWIKERSSCRKAKSEAEEVQPTAAQP